MANGPGDVDFHWPTKFSEIPKEAFHRDDIYDFGWETDLEWTVPEGFPSGVHAPKSQDFADRERRDQVVAHIGRVRVAGLRSGSHPVEPGGGQKAEGRRFRERPALGRRNKSRCALRCDGCSKTSVGRPPPRGPE